MNEENTRRWKSQQLRHKKSILASLNYSDIRDHINDIMSECDDARYYFNESEIYAELDPDTQEEVEMMYAELSDESYRLYEAMSQHSYEFNDWGADLFNDFVVNALGQTHRLLGYDAYETDYYGLTGYESELAIEVCGERLNRLTKKDLHSLYRRVLGILVSYFHIKYLYDYLKASTDIFDSEMNASMEVIRELTEAYERAAKYGFGRYDKSERDYDRMLDSLPDKVWLQ